MAYRFEDDGDWAEPISEETTKPEYQTAQIRLVDPSGVEQEYNYETGKYDTVSGSGLLYQGQARVIGIRWGVESGGESQANAMTLTAIRVQLPREGFQVRVKKNCKVFVDSCPRNPVLQQYMFTITSDFQGSMSASRTFQAMLDGDVQVQA